MAGVPDKNALRAGLFIVVALALAGTIIWFVNARGATGGREWTVAFSLQDDISGLAPGSEVRVGGKKVGQVTGVDFDKDVSHVVVEVSLPDDITVRQDPAVRVQSTLTGLVWLNFTDLGTGEPLDEGAVIRGQAGTLSDLVRTVNEIAPTVQQITERVRDEVLPKAERVLDEGELAVQEIGDAARGVNEILDEEGRSDLRITLARVREASEKLPQLIDDATELAEVATEAVNDVRVTIDETANSLTQVLEQAEIAAEDVVAAAEDTREAVATARGLITGNRGRINQIIERLNDTARTLDLASSEIRRSPWRLLYKPSGEQQANMNLYDAARQFAEGANALQDAAVALEGAAADPAADPEEVRRILEDLRASFEQYEEAQTQLFRRIRD